jgi:hypothetical protein
MSNSADNQLLYPTEEAPINAMPDPQTPKYATKKGIKKAT